MPPLPSAGLLLHRARPAGVEVLIGHMGGPLWAKKDERAWSIPKGEHLPDEEPLAAARREFAEELGAAPRDAGEPQPLGTVRQRNGKLVSVWAVRAEFDADAAVSNTFTMEWPPRSGRVGAFPEIDRAAWFDLPTAAAKLVAGQVAFLDRLAEMLAR